MGYHSDYSFAASDKQNEILESFFHGDMEYVLQECVKWYGWKEDMIKLSLQWKNITLTVTRVGEDPGDHERGIFLNGEMKLQKGRVVFDD